MAFAQGLRWRLVGHVTQAWWCRAVGVTVFTVAVVAGQVSGSLSWTGRIEPGRTYAVEHPAGAGRGLALLAVAVAGVGISRRRHLLGAVRP